MDLACMPSELIQTIMDRAGPCAVAQACCASREIARAVQTDARLTFRLQKAREGDFVHFSQVGDIVACEETLERHRILSFAAICDVVKTVAANRDTTLLQLYFRRALRSELAPSASFLSRTLCSQVIWPLVTSSAAATESSYRRLAGIREQVVAELDVDDHLHGRLLYYLMNWKATEPAAIATAVDTLLRTGLLSWRVFSNFLVESAEGRERRASDEFAAGMLMVDLAPADYGYHVYAASKTRNVPLIEWFLRGWARPPQSTSVSEPLLRFARRHAERMHYPGVLHALSRADVLRPPP